MKPVLNLLHIKNIPILQQLQWEEALLRADRDNWCLINEGSSPAIVMGISCQLSQLVDLKKVRAFSIPIIRRFSGGGTVIVDNNTLFVTFILQAASLSIAPFPKSIMEWSAKFYTNLFPTHAFTLRENDYAFNGRKWGGNAQSIIKGRWLHHSSLLWDYCPERMTMLLQPAKQPDYRQNRSHNDFICKLKDYYGDKNIFVEKLINELYTQFSIQKRDINDVENVLNLPHRKVTAKVSF